MPLSEFTPAADNYSKFGECLQGAASGCGALFSLSAVPQIMPFLYFSARVLCVCVSCEVVFEERCVWQRGAQGVIEERHCARRGRL